MNSLGRKMWLPLILEDASLKRARWKYNGAFQVYVFDYVSSEIRQAFTQPLTVDLTL